MQAILILEPLFKERIWGGVQLKEYFNYEIPNNKTGECWAISAHRNGDCIIKNGELKGKTLSHVYENHRELFNFCESPSFPLLTKILDASDDLSVQVHPDDEYAMKNENDLGKSECWYIIDCDEQAEIVYGHNAHSKDELIEMIESNNWNQFLRRKRIKPGDFFYVPTGTIHALCKGILVLETQQSSDTTYRVYDYDRLDDQGNKRELHIKQAIDVTSVPHEDMALNASTTSSSNLTVTNFVSYKYFTVEKWMVNGSVKRTVDKFLLVSVLNGTGKINNQDITKGDHFIVTSICQNIELVGDLELMISHL